MCVGGVGDGVEKSMHTSLIHSLAYSAGVSGDFFFHSGMIVKLKNHQD